MKEVIWNTLCRWLLKLPCVQMSGSTEVQATRLEIPSTWYHIRTSHEAIVGKAICHEL